MILRGGLLRLLRERRKSSRMGFVKYHKEFKNGHKSVKRLRRSVVLCLSVPAATAAQTNISFRKEEARI